MGASLRETGSRADASRPLAGSTEGFDPARLEARIRRQREIIDKAIIAAKAYDWLSVYGEEHNRDPGFAGSCGGFKEAQIYRARAIARLAGQINALAVELATADIVPAIAMEARQGTDPQGLDGEAATARAEGIARADGDPQ